MEHKATACNCPLCDEPPILRDGGESFRYECPECGMRTSFRATKELALDEWGGKAFKLEHTLFRPTVHSY